MNIQSVGADPGMRSCIARVICDIGSI